MHSAPLLLSRRTAAGFTLIELMIVVTLIAIGLALGTPYARDAVMNMRMTGHANDLMADLALARSEAVKRNVPVIVCTTTNGTTCSSGTWADGRLVFADLNANGVQDAATEPALRSRPDLTGDPVVQVCGDVVTSGVHYLPYRPSGMSTVGKKAFVMCDGRTTPLGGRMIDIGTTGRANTTRVTCPRNPDCS